MQPTDSEAGPKAGGLFPPTMWSVIVAAGEPDAPAALVALERLARAYWRPLYVFLRQRGSDHDSATDHVQGFFEHLISGEVLRRVERRESRFRSFLLAVFQNWLSHRHERADARKRGGGAVHVPLAEFDSVVSDPALAIAGESPERIFDRRWAREVFDRSVARLDAEIARMDRSEFQAELRRRITGPQAAQPAWAEVGAVHGVPPGAVKQAAHVLRQRLATLLRSEVRAVVGTEAEVDGELRYLIELLSTPGNRA